MLKIKTKNFNIKKSEKNFGQRKKIINKSKLKFWEILVHELFEVKVGTPKMKPVLVDILSGHKS